MSPPPLPQPRSDAPGPRPSPAVFELARALARLAAAQDRRAAIGERPALPKPKNAA